MKLWIVLCSLSLCIHLILSATPTTQRSSQYISACQDVNLDEVLDQTRNSKSSYKETLNYLYGDYFKIQSTFYAKYLAHQWADDVLSRDISKPSDQSPDGFHNIPGVNISYVVYIISAIISFIIAIILAIICCVRFEKISCLDSQREYTKCEKYWPRVCLGIFIIIILIWIIIGLVDISNLRKIYKNSECLRSRVYDNLFNGAKSADQTKTFGGLEPITAQVVTLPIALAGLSTQIPTILSSISPAQTALTTYKNTVSSFPTGVPGGTLSMSYPSPIHTTPTTTIPSTFIDILGTPTIKNSLIYNTTSIIDSLKSDLTLVSTALTSISTNMASSTTALNNMLTNLQSLNTNLTTFFQELSKADTSLMNGLFMSSIAFFSILLALIIIIIVLLPLFICFRLLKLRFVGYGILGTLVAFMIYGFVLSSLFGYLVPTLVDVCMYGDQSLQSKAKFRWSYQGIFSTEEMNYFQNCMPSENNNIVDQFLGPQLIILLNDVSSLSSTASKIQSSQYSSKNTAAYAAIGVGITNILAQTFVDLNDTASLTKLQQLSVSTNYACTATGFSSDSWVPSTTQTQIPCSITGGTTNNAVNCPLLTCNGCMDSNSLAILYKTKTQVQISTLLLTKYPLTLDCTVFANQLSNVWINYYIFKNTKISPVKTRYTSIMTNFIVSAAGTAITGIQTTVSTLSTSLNGYKSSVDSNTGLLSTVDCRVIAQTTEEYFIYTCKNYLNEIRLLLASLAFVSFSLPFLYCGIILILTRQMKRSSQGQIANDATKIQHTIEQQKKQNINGLGQKQIYSFQQFENSNIQEDDNKK